MLGGKVYYETTIWQGNTSVKGTGKTEQEARRKAEDRWAEKGLGR